MPQCQVRCSTFLMTMRMTDRSPCHSVLTERPTCVVMLRLLYRCPLPPPRCHSRCRPIVGLQCCCRGAAAAACCVTANSPAATANCVTADSSNHSQCRSVIAPRPTAPAAASSGGCRRRLPPPPPVHTSPPASPAPRPTPRPAAEREISIGSLTFSSLPDCVNVSAHRDHNSAGAAAANAVELPMQQRALQSRSSPHW